MSIDPLDERVPFPSGRGRHIDPGAGAISTRARAPYRRCRAAGGACGAAAARNALLAAVCLPQAPSACRKP